MNTFGQEDDTDLDSMVSTMLQVVVQTSSALQQITGEIAAQGNLALDANGKAIQKINDRLNTALGQQLSITGPQLDSVIAPIGVTLANHIGENNAQLNQLVGTGLQCKTVDGHTQCLPGSYQPGSTPEPTGSIPTSGLPDTLPPIHPTPKQGGGALPTGAFPLPRPPISQSLPPLDGGGVTPTTPAGGTYGTNGLPEPGGIEPLPPFSPPPVRPPTFPPWPPPGMNPPVSPPPASPPAFPPLPPPGKRPPGSPPLPEPNPIPPIRPPGVSPPGSPPPVPPPPPPPVRDGRPIPPIQSKPPSFPPSPQPGSVPPPSTSPPAGGGPEPTLPGGSVYPTLPPVGVSLPPGSSTVQPPIITTPPIGSTTTTVVPGQCAPVYVTVVCPQQLCNPPPQPEPKPPVATGPHVRVLGAGDERADDILAARCAPFGVDLRLELPGTQLWCREVNAMAKAVSDLGFKVFDWIQAAISATGDWLNGLQNQEDPTFHNPLHVLSDLWHLLTKGLAKLTFPLLQTLWNGVCMLRRGIGKIGKCDTTTLIGIGVVKLTWDTLKRIQLGSDAGVWATIDTSFELPVIERTLEYLLQYACPPEIPQPSETIEAYLRNQITEEQYRCWLAARGCSFVVWDAVTMSRREQLQPDEWIEWARRHQLPENIQSDGLRWRGWIQGDERAARLELYDELPTIMEHLHWLQRNVFDDEYVKDYDLMNGFEERFWKKFGNDLRAQGMKKEYAALHYAAHWINPAPGQLFEMLRRLRPGRVAKDIQFTETDLLRLLAEQDVAPYFRSRFRAIAYTPFGLRFLRQLYDTRVIDDKEASQRFQDIGYSPQDADLLVKAEVIRRARTVATQTNAYSAKNIRAFYLADEIDIATAKSKLNTLGYPDTVATDAIAAWDLQRYISDIKVGEKESKAMQLAAGKEAYINGTVRDDDLIGLLRDIGWRPNHAEMYTKGLRYKIIQDQTKALISTVRKSYLTGQIDRVQAESALRNITVTPERIGMYLTEWTLQLTVGRKELTAAQIMQKATEGILPVPVALQRLLNLNYTPTDAQLLMLGVQRKIAETEQKMLDAQAKQRAAEARIVMQAQKELQKQLDAIKKRLEQLGSASNLLKWLTDGVIGPEYATARLLALGAAESDVQIAVADALAKGAKASGKAAKAAPPAGGKPKGGGV